MREVLYRYTAGTGDRIVLEKFDVVRLTPKGKWIDDYGRKRFVINDATKRFAHETKEAALVSFRARTRRRIKILAAQLDSARAVFAATQGKTVEQVDALEVENYRALDIFS